MNMITTGGSATMSSLELRDIINEARASAGESKVRNDQFVARVQDELGDELGVCKKIAHPQSRVLMDAYDLTRDQCMLVSMRESKAVRRRVVAKLKLIEEQAVPAMLHDPVILQRLLLENVTQVVQLKAENDDLHTENLMLEQKVVADAPKVEFANKVVVTHETYSVSEAAKLIGTGQNRLMSFLRMKGWVCIRKNEPKQWVIEKGFLSAKLHSYEHPTKGPTVESTARVTGKGLVKLRELWLRREDDLLSDQTGAAAR